MRSLGVVLMLVFAGACGGGGGGEKPPVFEPVLVTLDGNVATLTLGDLKMVVDGPRGARITEFSLRGTNALVTADQNLNYGATFWPSPQSAWCAGGVDCWPPPDAIDSGPYGGDIQTNNSVAFKSGPQAIATVPGVMLEVWKLFTPSPAHGAVDVTYMLVNSTSSTTEITLSPWQISRVAAGGLTFFGIGTGDVTYAANTAPSFTVTEAAGARWYESAPVTHDSKAFADGTGWIAHVTPEKLLYTVSYTDMQPDRAAPGEAEIELFTNSAYVEVEEQGPYILLFPGDQIDWTVRWKLRPVPAATPVGPGSAELVSLATGVLAE